MLDGFVEHNLRTLLHRKSGNPRANRRKRHRLQSPLRRQPQRMRRRSPQRLGGSPLAAQSHARRVNHVTRLQLSAARNRGIPDRNASYRVALLLNRLAAFAMDRSRHARAQHQIVVRRVYNRIRLHLCDVALLNYNSLCGNIHGAASPRPAPIPADSRITTAPFLMRYASSRHASTVPAEVNAVLTSSIDLVCGTGSKSRSPTQRSRCPVTSLISAIESVRVLLAKIAPGFANLSKIVNSSSFISISSATASTIKSASRIASSTRIAVEISKSARSRTTASTMPPCTPSSNARLIHSTAASSASREISSTTVR